MNHAPGRVNAANPILPFQEFENLHFARFVVLDDQTLDDIHAIYGLPRREFPLYLAFLCDFDGPPNEFLEALVKRAEPGLRRVFSCCEGFTDDTDTAQWIRIHDIPIATRYVNWRGRTMRQVREEARLRQAVRSYLDSAGVVSGAAEQIRLRVRAFVENEVAAGRLALTPVARPSLGEKIADAVHFVGGGLLLALALPFVLVLVVARIRPLEKTDRVFAPRPDPVRAAELAVIEDHEVTNQFSAMGSIKPGFARLWVLRYILWLIDWAARHLFGKGRLARVRTIHFARWVFLDGRKRILFASNYDGSLESYMDDFINKVGFGLNVVFSAGIGYPATRWMLKDGSHDELSFKYYLRRHQLPTDVWYNAHPGITAAELERNGRIRKGLDEEALSEDAAREWAALL
jgi:hypothetical protein